MSRLTPIGLLAMLWLAALAWPAPAAAQVRRCVQPDLDVIYTDRHCEAFGAVEQAPRRHGAGASASRIYRGGCPRSLRDLLFEMNMAIDARDVNRLASVYDWVGMSSGSATAVMNRLDALVHRPLVDIVPVMPRSSVAPYARYATHAQADPVALRIEQTLANGSTPSHTIFGLKQYFGCVWIAG